MQPTFLIDRLSRGLLILQIALHNLRSPDVQLPRLVRSLIRPVRQRNNLRLRIRIQLATRANLRLVVLVGRTQRNRGTLRHAVALGNVHVAATFLAEFFLQLKGGCGGPDQNTVHAGQVIGRDFGVRGQEEHQRRNDKQEFGSELDQTLDVVFRDESGTNLNVCDTRYLYLSHFILTVYFIN